jgi:biuret amidohydrolase
MTAFDAGLQFSRARVPSYRNASSIRDCRNDSASFRAIRIIAIVRVSSGDGASRTHAGEAAMPYQLDHIDPTKTAMIVVDMQNDFVAEGAKLRSAAAAAMVPRLASTLDFCREKGIRVIYTAHVHRRDGSDMGLYDDLYSPIADRSTLVDGTSGAEIFPGLAPASGEHIIKKHRYSAFFATDLDLILREWGITTVIISGTTTENCCHATARDAMFNNYKVVFLSDATGSFDYPDVGQGAMSAEEVHKATLCILAFSTAHVMTVDEFKALAARGTTAARAEGKKAA